MEERLVVTRVFGQVGIRIILGPVVPEHPFVCLVVGAVVLAPERGFLAGVPVLFADSLEKCRGIDAVPFQVHRERVAVARRGVAYYLAVARIRDRIGSGVNYLVVVEVFHNHVAWRDDVSAGIGELGVHIRIPEAVIIVDLRLVLEQAVAFITPYLADFLTDIVVAQVAGGIVVFGDE